MVIQQRNTQIREERRAGVSMAELSRRYGLSAPAIRNITKDIEVPPQRGPRMKSFEERKPISDLHVRIGLAIANYREGVLSMGRREFGVRIGLSAIKVAEMEQGLLDFPLSLLEKLASEMGKTLKDLLRLHVSGNEENDIC